MTTSSLRSIPKPSRREAGFAAGATRARAAMHKVSMAYSRRLRHGNEAFVNACVESLTRPYRLAAYDEGSDGEPPND